MIPFKSIFNKYGFSITPEWITNFQLSCVEIGGSASFVSSDGLIITNHHVGAKVIHNLSSKDNDLIKNGFYAPTLDKELKCRGLEAKVLIDIEDMTQCVRKAVEPEMNASEAGRAVRKAVTRIEKEFSEKTGLYCRMVTLHAGALYHLYHYKVYDDVRLVFAPEERMAKFGGDPDNYGYPRYSLNVAFFRIYENSHPLKTEHYLRWNRSGIEENELVFCAGNPMFTFRFLTYSQMEFLRDVKYPMVLKKYIRQRDFFTEFSKKGEEQARRAGRDLWGALNEVKCFTGMLSGLNDKTIMGEKKRFEENVRNAVNGNPGLKKKYGRALDSIADAQKRFTPYYKSYFFFVEGEGFRSQYIWKAESLLSLARTDDSADEDRLRSRIMTDRPIYRDLEIARLTQSLSLLKEELSDHPLVKKIFGGEDPAKTAEKIIMDSQINDKKFRQMLVEGKKEAILSSKDPAIRLARMIEPEKRKLESLYQKDVLAVERMYGAQISRAIFESQGASIPPDATNTLRLSYGVVKSYYEDDGTFVPYQTTFRGLFERSDTSENNPPFSLAPSFIKARKRIDMNTPYNIVATTDASGGNSGSPLVNAKCEFVGILFDGNRQSLPHRFLYSDKQVRAVMVHGHGILESLRKVYDAGPLIKELVENN